MGWPSGNSNPDPVGDAMKSAAEFVGQYFASHASQTYNEFKQGITAVLGSEYGETGVACAKGAAEGWLQTRGLQAAGAVPYVGAAVGAYMATKCVIGVLSK